MPDGSSECELARISYAHPNGNPTEVTDGRTASEWTTGYKPVNPAASTTGPTYTYDDMGRLTAARFDYGTTVDTQLSPYVKGVDEPALPYIEPSTRATSQTYAYDPLDNPIRSDDDQHAILQRSAGTQTYGSATSGPNQVRSGAPISCVGTYQVGYDASGNVTSLTWTNGLETSTLDYTWDEVGHLIGASRGDSITIPRSSLAFSDQFVYDAGGNRIWRSTNVNGGPYYFAEVFRSLRLNGAAWNQGGVTGDFQDDDTTETDYVVSGGKSYGRIFYDASGTMPRADGNFLHVFIDVTDARGSVVATLDRPSGELVERVTYQPFGGTETDFRPKRWDQFRESYRYTEKEDDYALGIVYYGARYYMPGIQRWASPDPRAIHGLAGNINPYVFVANSLYRYVDPFGLQEGPPSEAGPGFSFDLTNVLSSIGGFFSNLFGGHGGEQAGVRLRGLRRLHPRRAMSSPPGTRRESTPRHCSAGFRTATHSRNQSRSVHPRGTP
jgi:RHS repeat-associated protein